MEEKTISIIVPVYNVEKYLPRCIESILKQTYTNFECILIDDGSPDRCGRICDEYAERDKRIVVIHQKNKGVSAARNAGLDVAKGEYVGFVDSDDYIAPEMYQCLVSAIEESNADFSYCAIEHIEENGDRYIERISPGLEGDQLNFIMEVLLTKGGVWGVVWNKLFRRRIIRDLRFEESAKICEDALFALMYCTRISSAVSVREPLYYYYHRPGSAVRTDRSHSVMSLQIHEKMISVAREIGKKPFHAAEAGYLDCCLQYREFAEAILYLRRYVRKHWNSILVNPCIYWKTKIVYFLQGMGVDLKLHKKDG